MQKTRGTLEEGAETDVKNAVKGAFHELMSEELSLTSRLLRHHF
jgi:hypothetical protein